MGMWAGEKGVSGVPGPDAPPDVRFMARVCTAGDFRLDVCELSEALDGDVLSD